MKCKALFVLALVSMSLLSSKAWASTTWYVNGVAGNDSNNCLSPITACKTIGHATSLAISGDIIKVAPAVYTENLFIDRSLTVVGSGAPTTIVDGGGIDRVFTISTATAHVTLSRITIRNGRGLYTGGGILNGGVLRIIASAISGNTVYNGSLGGGGISGGIVRLSSSTIANNVGDIAYAKVTLQNSIVGSCQSVIVTSNGYNISRYSGCNLSGPGDINNTDPQLGPLQYNGGPTQTMALPSGSPAVDAGNPSGCTDNLGHPLKTDQRGKPRPDPEDTGGCDMGAYERQSD